MRAHVEESDQRQLVAWLRAGADTGHVFIWRDGKEIRCKLNEHERTAFRIAHHARNGGQSKSENARAKAMGTVSGWPDLHIPLQNGNGFYSSLFVELKAKGGRVSKTQKQVHEMLKALGHYVVVTWTVQEAQEAILAYLGHI